MALRAGRYRWKFLWIALVLSLAIGSWLALRWLVPKPGSSEEVYGRIRIGMTRDEAVAVLRTHDSIEDVYCEGETKGGPDVDQTRP